MTLCPIIWADGFGSETLTAYAVDGTDTSFSVGGGRGGRNAVNVGSGGGEISCRTGSTYNRMIVSVAMKNHCALQIWADSAHDLAKVTSSGRDALSFGMARRGVLDLAGIDFSTYTQVSLGLYYTGSGTLTATVILNGATTVFSGAVTPAFALPPMRAVMTSDTGANTGTFCDFVVQGSATSTDTSLGDVAVRLDHRLWRWRVLGVVGDRRGVRLAGHEREPARRRHVVHQLARRPARRTPWP